jgi:hypothetical protein
VQRAQQRSCHGDACDIINHIHLLYSIVAGLVA